MRNVTIVLKSLSAIGESETLIQNNFIYVSVEIKPAYELLNQTMDRPRVALELTSLLETAPTACNSSAVTLRVRYMGRRKTLGW